MKVMSLSRSSHRLLVLCAASAFLAVACSPARPAGDEVAYALAERIERVESGLRWSLPVADSPTWTLAERMEQLRVPGVSIAVIEGFEVAWARGYGVRDADSGEPVTTETLFQAASISKPVAAAAALQLVEEGVLNLDEDVNTRLKSWKVPENEYTQTEKVTLRRLLSHSAGLTVRGFGGYAAGEPVPDILQVLDGEEPANSDPIRVDLVPGTQFRYSGGGYTVLQLLLEETTGELLPELIMNKLLEPLGMAHSSFWKPLPAELESLTTSGHDSEGVPHPGHQFLDHGSTCCGLWTTPGDLATFAIAIARAAQGEDTTILSQELALAMISPAVGDTMGLGFSVGEQGQRSHFRHGGGNPGFGCYLVLDRNHGNGAAIMTNGQNGGILFQEILRSIASEYDWPGYLPPEHGSFAELVAELRQLRQDGLDDPRIAERSLNRLGYQLLGGGQPGWAVQIFELNVELYPESFNVHDSLGEALMAAGDPASALKNYRKALMILELQPEIGEEERRVMAAEQETIAALEAELATATE